MKAISTLLVIAGAVLAPVVAVAGPIYVTVEGVNQGVFRGEALAEQHQDKLVAISYNHKVLSPRDAATGQASGKRQHSPVVIEKAIGAASPQLMQALISNETLPSVVFEFQGKDSVEYTVELSNATVGRIVQSTDQGADTGGTTSQTGVFEKVSFFYEKITFESTVGQTVTQDAWTSKI